MTPEKTVATAIWTAMAGQSSPACTLPTLHFGSLSCTTRASNVSASVTNECLIICRLHRIQSRRRREATVGSEISSYQQEQYIQEAMLMPHNPAQTGLCECD